MPIQIAGNTSANIAEVEAATKALRTTPKPIDYGSNGVYSQGNASGVMVAGLAQPSDIWQLRWGTSNPLAVIKKVIISAGNTATAFAAGVVTFNLFRATSYSANGTGGTQVYPGSGGKLRTGSPMVSSALTNANSADLRIASTAALGAGTKTNDANPIGSITISIPATAGTTLLLPTPLFQAQAGDYPLILVANEGISIQATVPITGTWTFSVQTQWEELASYLP